MSTHASRLPWRTRGASSPTREAPNRVLADAPAGASRARDSRSALAGVAFALALALAAAAHAAAPARGAAPSGPRPAVRASLSPGAAEAPELAAYRAFADGDSAAALVALARAALAWGARDDAGDAPAVRGPAWPGAPRPVYVTLVRGARIRACVGADAPLDATLGGTVWRLAVRALSADRRRAPVRADELDSLQVVVAFAGDGVSVTDPYTVRPAREGLRLETARGAIAFLPGEARTVQWAIAEARRAGVLDGPLAEAHCRRFPVVVLREVSVEPAFVRQGDRP